MDCVLCLRNGAFQYSHLLVFAPFCDGGSRATRVNSSNMNSFAFGTMGTAQLLMFAGWALVV